MFGDDEEGRWEFPLSPIGAAEAHQHEEVLKAARTLSSRIAADLSTWRSGKPLPSVRDAAVAKLRVSSTSGTNNNNYMCRTRGYCGGLSTNDIPCSSFGRAHAGGVPKDYGFTTKDINDAISYNKEREEQLFRRHVVPCAEQHLSVLKRLKQKQLQISNPLTSQLAFNDELAQLSAIHPRMAGSYLFPSPCPLRTSLGCSSNTVVSKSGDQDVNISHKGQSGINFSHLHNNPSYLQMYKNSSPPPPSACRKIKQESDLERTSCGKEWNSSTFVNYYHDDNRIKRPQGRRDIEAIEDGEATEIQKNPNKRPAGHLSFPNQQITERGNKPVARAHYNVSLGEISSQRTTQKQQKQNTSTSKGENPSQYTVLACRAKGLDDSISADFDSRDGNTSSDTRRHFTTLISAAMSLNHSSQTNNQWPLNSPVCSSLSNGGVQFSSEEKLCRYYLKLLNISLPQDDNSTTTVHSSPFDDPIRNGEVICTLLNGVVKGLHRASEEILNTVNSEQGGQERNQEIQKVSELLKSLNIVPQGDIMRGHTGRGSKSTSHSTTMLQRLQCLYCEIQSRLQILLQVFSSPTSSAQVTSRLRSALTSISCITGVNSHTHFSSVVSVGTDDGPKKLHLKNRCLQEVLAGRCENVWLVIANIILSFFVSSPHSQAINPRHNIEDQRRPLDVSVAEDTQGIVTMAPSPGQYASAVFNHYHTSHSTSSTSVSPCCVKYSTSLLKKLDYAVCQFILELQVLPNIPSLVSSEARREISPNSSENAKKTTQYLEAMQDPTKAPYVPESACFNPTRYTSANSGQVGNYPGSCSKFQPRMDPFSTILIPTVFPYLRNGTLLYDIGVKLLGPSRDLRSSSSSSASGASFSRNPKVKCACLANITLAQQLFMKHALKSDPPMATHCLTDPVAIYEGDTVFLLSLLEDIMRFAFKKQPRKLLSQLSSSKWLNSTHQASKSISSAILEQSKRTIDNSREIPLLSNDDSEPFIPPVYDITLKNGNANEYQCITPTPNEIPFSMRPHKSHCFSGGASGLSVGGSSRAQVIVNSDSKGRNFSAYNFNVGDEEENIEKSLEVGGNSLKQQNVYTATFPLNRTDSVLSTAAPPTYITNTLLPSDAVAPGRYNSGRQEDIGNKCYSTDEGANNKLSDSRVDFPLGNPHLEYLNKIDHSDRESNQLAVWLIRKLKPNYHYTASDGSFEVDFNNVSRYEQELEALCPRYVPITASSPSLMSSLGNKSQVSTVMRYLIFSDGVVLYHLVFSLMGSSVTSRLKGIQMKPKNIATKKLNIRKIIAFLSEEKKLLNGYAFLEDAVVAGDQRAVVLILRQLKGAFKNHID